MLWDPVTIHFEWETGKKPRGTSAATLLSGADLHGMTRYCVCCDRSKREAVYNADLHTFRVLTTTPMDIPLDYVVIVCAVLAICARSIYPVLRPFLLRFWSPIRHLAGPPSVSFVWGNVKQLEDNPESVHSGWIAQYGKVFKFNAEFGVSSYLSINRLAAQHHTVNADAEIIHLGFPSCVTCLGLFRYLPEARGAQADTHTYAWKRYALPEYSVDHVRVLMTVNRGSNRGR